MTDFGLLASGFVPKRLVDCLADYKVLFQQKLGANIDLSNDQPPMQLIGILAEREALLWELLDQIYQAGMENGASGASLDQLFALINIQRLPARPTRVDVTCTSTLDSVTPIDLFAGQILKTTGGGVTFISTADAVLPPAGGTVVVPFEAQTDGPTPCLAGTLTLIQTPVTGWDTATNAADGIVGRNIETDLAMKKRRINALVSVVASSSPAVVAAVLRLTDVTEVKEVENATAFPDADGRPAHSYELVVRGGDDDAIRAAIFATKPSGIETDGSVVGTVTDARGDAQTVKFSRPTEVDFYIVVTLTTDADFPVDGLTQVQAAILAYGQNELQIGETVSPFKIEQTIETPGIQTFDMKIGTLPSPTDGAPVAVGSTELAVFDSTKLAVTL